jgi:eukaryotic-like serine/threonine-protein kinase
MSQRKCNECGEDSDQLSDGLCAAGQAIHGVTFKPGLTNPEQPDTSDSPVGKQFGDYELLEEVARGGMGVIDKARHIKLNRIRALKIILSGRFSSKGDVQRFHIEGGSLADRLLEFHADPHKAMELLAKVGRAVHHAHQRGILHRNLKSANILLEGDDQPRITDLGLARNTADGSNLTNTGAVLGTPSYMPPEQATGNAVITTAADIYSLGAIMYELLTGVPPYRGATAMEIVLQVREGKLEPPQKKFPSVDRDLQLICLKCLEHVPDERYPSALAVVNDLEAWVANEPISISAPSSSSSSLMAQASRWFRQNRQITFIGFAVLMGIIATMPFALTFVAGGDFSEVYDRFPLDQRPWLFSFGKLPNWFNLTMGFSLLFILWPSVGFLNALVGRPKTVWKALGTGCMTAILLTTVFSVLLGWMPLLRMTNDDARTKVLTSALWPKDDESKVAKQKEAEKLFTGLEDIPPDERAGVVADRLRSDRLASAPVALLIIFAFQCIAMIPVVYGTAIGFTLLQRGHRIRIAWLRYTLAWAFAFMALFMSIDATVDIFFGDSNSLPELAPELATTAISGILFWLVMRRWRKQSTTESAPASTATVLSGTITAD